MSVPSIALAAAGVLALGGILLAVRARTRQPAVVGEVIASELGSPLSRVATAALLVAAAIWLFVSVGPGAAGGELGLLVGALVFAIVRPSFADRVSGTLGVRRGWQLLRHEELEEWRLIGEHLRFRLDGEWTAVPVPVERQAALRERLVSVAPDRESAFGHGSGRPDYDPAPQ